MGFLMKLILFVILSLSLFYGCSGSLIRLKTEPDRETYPMFGKTPERDFYISQNIGDTLIKKWENDVNGGFTNTSVTAYGGFIFVGDLSGRIFCFNDTTGKVEGKLKNKGAVFTAPVIEKSNIIFAVASENGNASNLISYDFIKGKENYDKEIKGRILTQIIKEDSAVIFNTEDGKIYKYSIDGEEKWEFDSKSFTHSSPALFNGIVFFGNDKGEILAVNSNDGKLIYRKKIGLPFFSGATIREGVAYIGNDNGKLYAVEIQSGKVRWEFESNARITMVPAVKNNIIIAGNLNGDLYAIDRANGRQIWKTSTYGILNATPLITDNFIVVPDLNKKFYLINFQTGKVFQTYNLDGVVKLSPVITDNTLFIGYENGNICAYKF
jgi:eukaryotic-like serine/threonine-protein kinase